MQMFNEWFLSLPEGRQSILREDKWMLANAAFEAGKRASEKSALQDIIDDLDNIWTAAISADMENARIKTKNEGHGYRVIDREAFRAALKRINNELQLEE